ncbi:MAG: hypothetical protein KF898_03230 [Parachlamydiales bacterium]|nr:hypothetical protein [Verrucomicrobiota bacterium]MBX3718646.1 hypothetical protein [Candidatus Acheromyda pituitae]
MSSISSINSSADILLQQIQQDQIQQNSDTQDETTAQLVAMMQNITTLLDSLQDNSANGNPPPADVVNQVNSK